MNSVVITTAAIFLALIKRVLACLLITTEDKFATVEDDADARDAGKSANSVELDDLMDRL